MAKSIEPKRASAISPARLLQRVKELQIEVDTLRKEWRKARDHMIDLGTQNEDLLKRTAISPEELARGREIAAQHRAMDNENQQIVEWFRENRTQELREGRHTGMTLAQVVIMYMARGLELEREKEGGNAHRN